jgi:hypothetical protein
MNNPKITPIAEISFLSDENLSSEIFSLEQARSFLIENAFNDFNLKTSLTQIRQIEDQICYLAREFELRKSRKNQKNRANS